jgi:hypothetical protein
LVWQPNDHIAGRPFREIYKTAPEKMRRCPAEAHFRKIYKLGKVG